MNESSLLVLVGLLGLGIGFALGLAVAMLRAPRAATVINSRVEPVIEIKAPDPARIDIPDQQISTPPAMLPFVQPVPPETSPARPSMNPINLFARAIQSDVRPAIAPPKSIAAQVDEVLQEMLKDSTLESRAIRLLELPGKGMVVMVGLDQYDGVNSVPDEAIRNLLRAAVAEWEIRAAGQAP